MEERERILRRVHPLERANILSRIFFTWALPIFAEGYKKDLTVADLYEPRKVHESSGLGDTFEAAWKKEARRKHPSLWKVIFKVYWKDVVCQGLFPIYNELIYELLQPLILKVLLEYYEPNQTSVTVEQAYWYAAALVGSNVMMIILGHTYMYATQHLGMKVRLSICSLIYRKSLRLSKGAVGDTSVGQIVNLVSNDVRKFDMLFHFMHVLWISPILIVIIMILIYQNLGPAALSGIIMLILFMPVEAYLGKKSASYYKRSAEKRDKRVGLMNEIITGIQVIKMYTWEKPFAKLVELARKAELKEIRGEAYIRAYNHSVWFFMNRFSIFICIVTYIVTGYSLNAQYVYVTTSFYNTLRLSLEFIPYAVTIFMEAHESVKRIEKFLASEEIDDPKCLKHNDKSIGASSAMSNGTVKKKNVGIDLQKVTAKWDATHAENTLENINFSARPNQLIAIVGTVGSGKSTIFQVLLKELEISTGTLEVSGSISYASQEPWLFSGSIRQNILFGQKFDEVRYKKIIQVCALERDLKLFPYGDRTIIGEKGVMLSGGQKARISLARAIYRESDIYLLDDPLSAVDTHVGKQLFDQCISSYLKDKCTVLITHQLQYLSSADQIYLLEDGKVVASGSYREIQSHANDFSKLFKSEDDDKEKEEKEQKLLRAISLKEQDEIPEEEKEDNSSGKIASRIYGSYVKAAGGWLSAWILLFLFIGTQGIITCTDYFLTFWVNLEQDRFEAELNFTSPYDNSSSLLNISTSNDSSSQSLDTSVPQEIVDEGVFTSDICMIIYSVLMALIIIVALVRSVDFFRFCMKASQVLHNNMFERISTATMRFFHTNPTGRILNRFSTDMGLIDDTIPEILMDTIQIALMVLSIVTLVCVVNAWFLIPTVCIFALFYYYRTIYIATSRDLKRLEGLTRSPMYSHFTASLQGLTTIRAYGAQHLLRNEYDNHQDLYSSAYYTQRGIARAFAFWLDMNCVVYVAIVIASFFVFGTEKYAGNVGLAITQSIALTGILQWGMRQWSELENQMTGVERVVQYTEIASEPNAGKYIPSKGWPSEGSIEFKNVSLRYSPTDPYVLKNLNFTINPKEKIGIVGRTGAGKSSLITTLFRLAEIEGDILIDKINTSDIPLQNLRRILSIIPQEPVLFSGTIRKNLDPFDEYDDEKVWDSLNEVELKESISDLPGGLHSNVSDGGSNFSVGQRQLFCLARAVLRSNKILVLDEATANVDPQTDELIQKTIRRKFNECTVLTIAHRLHTIMDSDRVLVMDEGRLVEFDHPHALIQAKGVFNELVTQTGKAETKTLGEIAKQSYNGRK